MFDLGAFRWKVIAIHIVAVSLLTACGLPRVGRLNQKFILVPYKSKAMLLFSR